MKNTILKSITAIALFVFCFCGCCLDTPYLPLWFYIIMVICLLWLALFAYANYGWKGSDNHTVRK